MKIDTVGIGLEIDKIHTIKNEIEQMLVLAPEYRMDDHEETLYRTQVAQLVESLQLALLKVENL